jgi:hypothetical protein
MRPGTMSRARALPACGGTATAEPCLPHSPGTSTLMGDGAARRTRRILGGDREHARPQHVMPRRERRAAARRWHTALVPPSGGLVMLTAIGPSPSGAVNSAASALAARISAVFLGVNPGRQAHDGSVDDARDALRARCRAQGDVRAPGIYKLPCRLKACWQRAWASPGGSGAGGYFTAGVMVTVGRGQTFRVHGQRVKLPGPPRVRPTCGQNGMSAPPARATGCVCGAQWAASCSNLGQRPCARGARRRGQCVEQRQRGSAERGGHRRWSAGGGAIGAPAPPQLRPTRGSAGGSAPRRRRRTTAGPRGTPRAP